MSTKFGRIHLNRNLYRYKRGMSRRYILKFFLYFCPYFAIFIYYNSNWLAVWWGGWSLHHISWHHSLCLDISILRHLHTRIRESILLSYYSSNLRAHGVCDYGTLPVMWQDLTSYLTTYIYKYIGPSFF